MLWNAKNGAVLIGDTEMEYVSFGAGEKILILLPGLSDGLATVRGKALMLAPPYRKFFKQYTVYMFSRKNVMPEGYSIRDMARDQSAAMKAVGISHASVMGVSQGGMIAQYLAIDRPELVDKLVLAVTAPCVNDTVRRCVSYWMELAKRGDHRKLMIDTAEKSYSEKRLKQYRIMYPFLGLVGKPANYDRFLINAKAILGFDATDDLDRINCPALILGGAEDKTVGPAAAGLLHEHLAGSTLHIYPGLGHAAYEEAPDFNERVFRFLSGESC